VTAGISAVVAVGIAVVATVMLRGVPTTAEAAEAGTAGPAEASAAEVEARRAGQPEEPVQLIRSGGGCVACPGEHGPSAGQRPRFRRPDPSDRGAGAA
jgi:hypothetical protein